MTSLLWPAGATVVWAALAYRVWGLRRDPGDPTLRMLCVALGGIALALTFAIPAVYLATDAFVGIPNLSRLVMNLGALLFSMAVQQLLVSWLYPPEQARRRGRRWLWLYLPAVAAQVVLFAGAPVDEEAVDFTVRYGDEPSVMALLAILSICLAITIADIVRLCWRYAAAAQRPYLRIGLRSTGLGAIAGLCYWVVELVRQLVRLATWPSGVVLLSDHATQILFALTTFVGTVFVAVGLTIPAWGPRLDDVRRWISQYRDYRRLRPLWTMLYRATPEIALEPPSARDPWWIGDLDYRLVRRVIEIRDGRLALRPFLDPVVAERAAGTGQRAGLSGVELQAAIEAASLVAAVRAKERGQSSTGGRPDDETPGGADLSSEAAWLVLVARALPSAGQLTGSAGHP